MSFLSPWAVLFERADPDVRQLVHRYESMLTPLIGEVLDKRSALLESHRKVSSLYDQLADGAPGRVRADQAARRQPRGAARHRQRGGGPGATRPAHRA